MSIPLDSFVLVTVGTVASLTALTASIIYIYREALKIKRQEQQDIPPKIELTVTVGNTIIKVESPSFDEIERLSQFLREERIRQTASKPDLKVKARIPHKKPRTKRRFSVQEKIRVQEQSRIGEQPGIENSM